MCHVLIDTDLYNTLDFVIYYNFLNSRRKETNKIKCIKQFIIIRISFFELLNDLNELEMGLMVVGSFHGPLLDDYRRQSYGIGLTRCPKMSFQYTRF